MLEHLSPLERRIYLLRERNPDLPVYKIARIAGISYSRAARILRKLGMNEVEAFTPDECSYMEKLPPEDRIDYLNRNWKAIPYKCYHILDGLPLESLVPIHRFQKLLFDIQMKAKDPNIMLEIIGRLEEEYRHSGLFYSFFHVLLLKLFLYNFMGMKTETLKLFKRYEEIIRKLPRHLSNQFYTLALNAALHTGETILAGRMLGVLEKYLRTDRGKLDENVREYVVDAYIVMGNYTRAFDYSQGNPVRYYRLLRFMGRYENLIGMEVPRIPTFIEKFFLTLDRAYALIFTGNPGKALLTLLPVYSRLEDKYKTAMRNFHIFMAAYNAVLENPMGKNKHLRHAMEFSEGYIFTLVNAFLNGKVDGNLWSRDLRIVKDWLDGRVQRAVDRARKYGGLWTLHMVALFHPKPFSRLYRYRELEPVLNLMKMPLLRLNIFSSSPILYFRGRRIPLGNSKVSRTLIKLVMEGGQMDASRIDSRVVGDINRFLGIRILKKEDGIYKLNARLRSDYFRFLELYRRAIFARNNGLHQEYRRAVSRMKRIFQCIPFNRLSFIDRELDDYRTSIKLMMEEVLQ